MKSKLQRWNVAAAAVPVIVVLLTAIIVVAMQSKASVKAPEPTPITTAGTIQVKGTVLCLPHKNTDGPQTMECALGIKDEKGLYYALSDTDSGYKNISSLATNEAVTVTGTLVKGENKTYPTVGTLKVTAVTKIAG